MSTNTVTLDAEGEKFIADARAKGILALQELRELYVASPERARQFVAANALYVRSAALAKDTQIASQPSAELRERVAADHPTLNAAQVDDLVTHAVAAVDSIKSQASRDRDRRRAGAVHLAPGDREIAAHGGDLATIRADLARAFPSATPAEVDTMIARALAHIGR